MFTEVLNLIIEIRELRKTSQLRKKIMGSRSRLIENEIDGNSSNQDFEATNGRSDASGRNDVDNEVTTTSAQPPTYTSQLAAFICILNVTIGAGLLAMPYATQNAGLVSSLITMVVFVISVIVTCIICTELTVKTDVESLHKIVQAHSHYYVYQFSQIAILLLVFGTAIAYIVIIGDQSDRVLASLYGHEFCYTWYMNRTFVMSFVTIFLIKPLCCAKTVDFLKYASFAGLLSLAFIIYVVISEFMKREAVSDTVNYFPKNLANIGNILPVYCISFLCHLSWVPTVATVRKEEKYTSYYTISIAMITAGLIYATVSIFALLTFGASIEKDLTESFSSQTWAVLTTIGIIAFKCVVTLPLALLPLRLSLIDIMSKLSNRFNNFSEPTKRISVTLVTLNLALILALYIPDILMAVDVLGCFAVLFVFAIPALCYLNLVKENRLMKQEQIGGFEPNVPIYSLKDKFKIWLSYFFIVFGIIMTIVVLYRSIEKMMDNEKPAAPICYK